MKHRILFLKRIVYLLNLGQIRYTTNFKCTSFNFEVFSHTPKKKKKKNWHCNSCLKVKYSHLKLLQVFSPKAEKLFILNMKTCNKFKLII